MCSVLLFYHLQETPYFRLLTSGAWHNAWPRVVLKGSLREGQQSFALAFAPLCRSRRLCNLLFDFKEFRIQVESKVEPKQLRIELRAELCGFAKIQRRRARVINSQNYTGSETYLLTSPPPPRAGTTRPVATGDTLLSTKMCHWCRRCGFVW